MPRPAPSDAVVICTRNRPVPLRRTLNSIAAHPPDIDLQLVVVDASDARQQARTRRLVESFALRPSTYLPYTDAPSSARQRNAGLDLLSPSVEIVHFIDDDVTVHSGYFETLSETLRGRPNVGGVGGVVLEPSSTNSSARAAWLRYLFLLSHPEPGRVLPSGIATSAQHHIADASSGLRTTAWLSGCASYRRPLLEQHRFDRALTGYSMLEDLDLSYRIHQQTRLVVQPRARLTHRRASRNRLDAERYSYALTVHRRWFVEKHFAASSARLAYWWGLVGQLLAILTSSSPSRPAALRGLIRGVRTVLARDHPLLRS